MQAHGSDRLRTAGGRIILHSRFPKGWTARVAKSGTHAEFPGSAVLWDDQAFEVVAADALPAGGVRYVLEEWREHHTMRDTHRYDEESEAALSADHTNAKRQRRNSFVAGWSSLLLGHLPYPVQSRMANELGLSPSRMTILSTIPSVVLLGVCVWLTAGSMVAQTPSRVPFWLWLFAIFMTADSATRFMVAMTQMRGMGSLTGTVVYILYWFFSPHRARLVPPFESNKGEGVFTLPPTEDVARRDSLEMRAALLTLLTPAEQVSLASRLGFDYRRHAYGPAWAILVCAALGVATSIAKVAEGRISAVFSLLCAGAVVIEQVLRLLSFRRGPAGSVFGVVVRPFVRDLLERK